MVDAPTVKEYAEFFVCGLAVGVVSTHEVAVWADSIIEKEDKPPIEMIEVTLACNRNIHDAISCLRKVKGELRPDVPINLITACLLKKLRRNEIDHGQALRALYSASYEETASTPDQMEIIGLEDSWCLAQQGIYGNLDELKKELEELLEKRRDYMAHLPIQ